MRGSKGNNMTTKKVDVAAVRAKLGDISAALRSTFIERDEAIDVMLLSAITRNHPLYLGPPGTGKSYMVRCFVECIGGAPAYFETLLTKFSTEDELCGPIALSKLKLDKAERATDGYLPKAFISFLDETWKGNDSVLNALLGILGGERRYKGQDCPLWMAVGASNELPADDCLDALWDRFVLRMYVDYIGSEAAWSGFMTDAATEQSIVFKAPCQVTPEELQAAYDDVRKVGVPGGIIVEFRKLRAALRGKGVIVSDRRWRQCLLIVKAAAWLDGDAEVNLDHLPCLENALWSKPEHREHVTAALKSLDKSVVGKALAVIDDALRTYANRPSDEAQYFDALPAMVDELELAAKTVRRMADSGEMGKRATRKVQPRLTELQRAHTGLKLDLKTRYGL
jgi:MoxR-like ATPase